jgi:VanZ family protein
MVRRWLIWFGFLALLTYGLLLPDPGGTLRRLFAMDSSGSPSEQPVQWSLFRLVESPVFYDVIHVMGYGLLTVLTGWLHAPTPWKWVLLAFLCLHALVFEYVQGFQPLRHSTWSDVGYDHLGIALGFIFTWRWWFNGDASQLAARGDR